MTILDLQKKEKGAELIYDVLQSGLSALCEIVGKEHFPDILPAVAKAVVDNERPRLFSIRAKVSAMIEEYTKGNVDPRFDEATLSLHEDILRAVSTYVHLAIFRELGAAQNFMLLLAKLQGKIEVPAEGYVNPLAKKIAEERAAV